MTGHDVIVNGHLRGEASLAVRPEDAMQAIEIIEGARRDAGRVVAFVHDDETSGLAHRRRRRPTR
jgi:hypothetical protein